MLNFSHYTKSTIPVWSFYRLVGVLALLHLSGCGYMWQKAHGTDQLLELSGGMSKEQVRAIMGAPDTIAYDENNITIQRYKLYDSHKTADDLPLLIMGGWMGVGTLYPISRPDNYWLSFIDGQLCNWENSYSDVNWSSGDKVAKKVREWRDYCKAPRIAKYPAPSPQTQEQTVKRELATTGLPIYMPPPVKAQIHHLAVFPMIEGGGYAAATWLDLGLNVLRKQHPDIVLVDRDLRPIMNEVLLQHSGRVSDETTVRVGRLAGADAIITFNVEPLQKSGVEHVAQYGGTVAGYAELKLVLVEVGTILFRQRAMATAQVPAPRDGLWPQGVLQEAHRKAVSEASYFAVAAFLSAFGDNPLGIVPDMNERSAVRLSGVLDGSPAHLAGIEKGDRILAVNGRAINAWVSLTPYPLPATLTVERAGREREIMVMKQ